ncbi:MAG TPA: ATP-binding protein [Acidimicrobiales bacterium]|nr:ATP-binding protein [Acidimicrobiales bacterium]
MSPPAAHRATTASLQAAYPFVSDAGPAGGPLLGRDVMGGPFFFDPWELYHGGLLTNPNVLVVGQLGRGKSTFVKTLVWRQLAFGRKAWIVDPKGEYGPLAAACGVEPVKLVPGGDLRLNPLTVPGGAGADEAARRGAELAGALLACSLGRTLHPAERTALDVAVRRATSAGQPTLPQVVERLLEPDPADASLLHTDPATLASDGRIAALELRRMVAGDLAGMFDGPTTPSVDLAGGLVVVDVSATFATPALPLVMTCATAWLQAALASGASQATQRLVVVDEAWSILSDLGTARWAQATFKLARAFGVANVVVVHRLSDLRAAGPDGSAQEKLAEGLLADSETRVVFGQPPSEAEVTARMLRLSRREADLVPRLPRGAALWKLGARSFLVRHLLGAPERRLVDTDAAMRGSGGPLEAPERRGDG